MKRRKNIDNGERIIDLRIRVLRIEESKSVKSVKSF